MKAVRRIIMISGWVMIIIAMRAGSINQPDDRWCRYHDCVEEPWPVWATILFFVGLVISVVWPLALRFHNRRRV